MRIFEIANAEDQLGLLRVIIDNTWTAIAQQAERQRLERVKQQNASKNRPKKSAKAPSIKPAAKPPQLKNSTQNLTQTPNKYDQPAPLIVPSPQQNGTLYRGYTQSEQPSEPPNKYQAITPKPPKW